MIPARLIEPRQSKLGSWGRISTTYGVTEDHVQEDAFCGAMIRWSLKWPALSVQQVLGGVTGEKGSFMTPEPRLALFRWFSRQPDRFVGRYKLASVLDKATGGRMSEDSLSEHIAVLRRHGLVVTLDVPDNPNIDWDAARLAPSHVKAIGQLVVHMDALQGTFRRGRFDGRLDVAMPYYQAQTEAVTDPVGLQALLGKAAEFSAAIAASREGAAGLQQRILDQVRRASSPTDILAITEQIKLKRPVSLATIRRHVNELITRGELQVTHADPNWTGGVKSTSKLWVTPTQESESAEG